MSIPDKDKLFAKLEAMGEESVGPALAQGLFAQNKRELVNYWLSKKEKERQKIAEPSRTGGITVKLDSAEAWKKIKNDYEVTKKGFGKKINFVTDRFKRKIIFRDIEQAYILADSGFSKPAVILAGSVIEELLRIYLGHKRLTPGNNTFDGYIKACQDHGLLESAIHRLTDSVRHFRNLVHLENEGSSRSTISKATSIGAVSSIFSIVKNL